jgi:N-acetylmuramoyl-L-alanine amidase
VLARGECIFTIADSSGHKWETIWDAPENKALREKRKRPGVLMPGDAVIVPDLTPKSVSLAMDATHKIRVSLNLVTVRLRVLQSPEHDKTEPGGAHQAAGSTQHLEVEDPEPVEPPAPEPRRGVAYEVRVDGKQIASGKTDQDGVLEVKLRPSVTSAEVVIEPGGKDELRLPIELGGLDPIDELSGVKQRLYNLGFDCGDTGPEVSENFEAVLCAFQEQYGLKVTGELDDETRQTLLREHTC